MVDWKIYKGEGPWAFEKSPVKNHYNEGSHITNYTNPVWELDRVIPDEPVTEQHHPFCGYWPDLVSVPPPPATSPEANIFGLFNVGATIWGCYFDGVSSLTFTGFYESPSGDINCLVLDENDDTIVTVAGDGSTAELRKISTTPVGDLFPLDSTITPFNDYDVTQSIRGDMIRCPDTGIVYYAEGAASNEGGRLLKLHGTTYAKQLRSFIGTVTEGTDSNLYIPDYVYSDWVSYQRPITGEYWESFYSRIPDDHTDGDVTAWGTDALLTNGATEFRMKIYEGELYAGLVASPTSRFRVYNSGDLEIDRFTNAKGFPYDFVIHNDYIYSVEGVFDCRLRKYDAETLVFIEEVLLSPGRADEIIVMGGNLIILNDPYIATNQLFKVNPSTMAIIDWVSFPVTDLWQRIAKIDDTFLAVGGNNHAMVFNVDSFTIVDTVYLSHVDMTGWNTRDLIVQNL